MYADDVVAARVVAGLLGALPAVRPRQSQTSAADGRVETVTGPVSPASLGVTLMHEHVLVDFIGAAEVSRARYDAECCLRRGVAAPAAAGETGVSDARRVHARIPRTRSSLLKRLSEGLRHSHPVEHRLCTAPQTTSTCRRSRLTKRRSSCQRGGFARRPKASTARPSSRRS